jgi:hypothetical protein
MDIQIQTCRNLAPTGSLVSGVRKSNRIAIVYIDSINQVIFVRATLAGIPSASVLDGIFLVTKHCNFVFIFIVLLTFDFLKFPQTSRWWIKYSYYF